jgi:hypothetical protein
MKNKIEFKEAVKWKTTIVDGEVKVVDEMGLPLKPRERVKLILTSLE